MNSPSQYDLFAQRLFAAGHGTEAVRVRALSSYKPKPEELPPLARALLPDASSAELVAVDLAARLGQFLEAHVTQKDGTIAVATAVMALALAHRRFELMASQAQLDDGAPVPSMNLDAWNVRGIELAERLAKLTKIVLGEDGQPGSIIMERA